MKALREQWGRLNGRHAALSRREKVLVAGALILGPLLIANALILDPQSARGRAQEKSIAQKSTALAETQMQIGRLQQQLKADPDAALKAELAALQGEQEKSDNELRQLGATLIRPEEMNGLLERLLARQPGLRLLSLKTLAPRSVLAEKPVSAKADAAKPVEKLAEKKFDLYRHGVEIRLEGNYGELLAYVAQLEQLQQKLLWGQLQYKVLDYPRAEMTLIVYTLSPDRAWLAL